VSSIILAGFFIIASVPSVTGAQTSCYTFTRNFEVGMTLTNVEATALQNDLAAEDLWNAGVSFTTFNSTVSNAISAFQEKYSADVLVPNNLTHGTRYFGDSTRQKMNSLYGCNGTDNPPINLPDTIPSPVAPASSRSSTRTPAVYTPGLGYMQSVIQNATANSGQPLTVAQVKSQAQAQGLTLTDAQAQAFLQSQVKPLPVPQVQTVAPSTDTTTDIATSEIDVSPGYKLSGGVGSHLVIRCAQDQYWDTYGANGGCYNNPATSTTLSQVILKPVLAGVSGAKYMQDPYCNVDVYENGRVPTSRTRIDPSTGTTIPVWALLGSTTSACIAGEAGRNANYVSPYTTTGNMFGYKEITSIKSSFKFRPGTGENSNFVANASNYCRNSVSLEQAKALSTSMGTIGHENDYMSNSRLLIMPTTAGTHGLGDVESIGMGYGRSEETPSTGLLKEWKSWSKKIDYGYTWDGKLASIITHTLSVNASRTAPVEGSSYETVPHAVNLESDWTNPEFNALFQNYQMPSIMLAKCLDANYVSNFTPWAGHFTSAMKQLRAKGLVQ